MKKKKYTLLYIVLLGFSVILLTGIMIQDKDNNRQYKISAAKSTWTDYSIEYYPDTTIISGTIPVHEDLETILAFYTVHQNVKAYMNHTLVYQYPIQEDNLFAKTPGYSWNYIALPEEASEITLEITSPYSGYLEKIPAFYYGTILSITCYIIDSELMPFLICTIIFFLGVCMIFYWLFIRSKVKIKHNLLYLGIFSIVLSAWSINESQLTTLIMHNNIVCSYISFITLMLLPMPFILFVKSFYEEEENRIWNYFFSLNLIQIATCLVLQLLKIADLRETLWSTHAIMVLLAAIVIYFSAKQLRKKHPPKQVILHILCLFVCTITLFLDLGAFYWGAWDNNSFGRVGFLFYVLVLGLASTKESSSLMALGKQAAMYQELALKDQLTGLYNRTAFYKDFSTLSDTPENTAVIAFDLNNLKEANDTKGHIVGDQYITASAYLIENTYSKIGKCYRTGGDEFVVLVEDALHKKYDTYLTLFQEKIADYNRRHTSLTMQIACGSAIYSPEIDKSLEDTYNRADKEMYLNKNELKNAL